MTYKEARENIGTHLATLSKWKVTVDTKGTVRAITPKGSYLLISLRAAYLGHRLVFEKMKLDFRAMTSHEFVNEVLRRESLP